MADAIRDAVNEDHGVLYDRFFNTHHDRWYQLCSGLDTLGDATDALMEFERGGLGTQAETYLRFYGMFQAVILQQDALDAINEALVGSAEAHLKKTSWTKIRDLRNLAVGHPTDKKNGVPGKRMRSFVARVTITARSFLVLTYDEVQEKPVTEVVAFGTIYDKYKDEAVAYAHQILHSVMSLRGSVETAGS